MESLIKRYNDYTKESQGDPNTIFGLYESNFGKKLTPVTITPLEEIFNGKDLKYLKHYEETSPKGECHFNAARAAETISLSNWDVTFCEGWYGEHLFEHCWNKVANKKNGEFYYIDFTLGPGEALLLNEWDKKDIITLFNIKHCAFVPFREVYWFNDVKHKGLKRIREKYYPFLFKKEGDESSHL